VRLNIKGWYDSGPIVSNMIDLTNGKYCYDNLGMSRITYQEVSFKSNSTLQIRLLKQYLYSLVYDKFILFIIDGT